MTIAGKLPSLDFAKNHRGSEDIAMFDFTSLYSSKCSVRLVERMNKCLLMGIVGDSLHEVKLSVSISVSLVLLETALPLESEVRTLERTKMYSSL